MNQERSLDQIYAQSPMHFRTQMLRKCVDMLAVKYVPALEGAKVICFVRQYEIWSASGQCLIVGSYPTLLLWLGCVAMTKRVLPFGHYPPEILNFIYRSAAFVGIVS